MDDLTLSQKLFGGSSTKNDVSAATTSGASVVYMIAVTSSSGGEVVLKPEVEDDWDSLEEGTDYIVVDEDGEFDDEDEDDSIEYDDGSVLDLTDGDGADIEGIEADTYTVAAYKAEAVALAEEAEPDAEVDPQPDGTMDSTIDDGDAEDTDSTETAEVDSLPGDSDTVTEDESDFSYDDDEDPCIMDYGDTVEGAEVSDGYTVASTIGSVNEGDRVAVMVQDGQLTVIGVVGSGDVQQAENAIAQEAADEAAADAAAAQNAADSAQQSANDAQTAANNAQTTANAAQASANEAATAASNAQTAADNAAKEAQEANEKAQSAANDAAKANTDLSAVKTEVTNIKADAVTLRSDLEGQIEAVTTTMETDYAKKTDLSDTEATLRTEISTSAAGITQTVSETYAKKTNVSDAITTAKADLQTQITQNADSIKLTAKSLEQAQVDIQANATNITEAKNAAATAQSTANAAKTDAQEAATAAANAQSAADAANTAASKAQTKANEAANAAATAQTAADKAKTDLATAQQKLAEVEANANATAEDLAIAQQAVETAQAAADAAQSTADTAKANAAAAQSTADTAKANAATAQSTANTAKTNAANAQKAAEDAQASADAANDALAVLEPRVTAAETAIEQNSEAITLRATKTEVSTAKSEAISTAAADAASKADSALADAKTYADAQIKVSADSITQTVSETYQPKGDYVTGTSAYSQLTQTVNSINGEVFNSDGSSKLEQTASSLTSQINSKQDKGDYVTGTAAYSTLTQTVNGLSSTVQSHSGSISNLQHTAEGIQVRLKNQQTVKNLVSKSRRLDGWGHVVGSGVTLSKNVSTSAPEFGEVTVAQFNASTANSSEQSSYIRMTNAVRVTSGKKYTFSMWARKVSGGNARPRFSVSTTNQTGIIPENLTTEWKRYSYTFTLGTIATSGNRGDITTSFGVSVLANQTGVFEICCPQLEAGDTMNPWSANSVDATDYMSFTQEGLVIGDMTEDGLGNNVLIDSDSVDLRTGSYVCGSFSLNDGYAAHASAVECVAMTSGSSLKWPNMCPWKVTLDKSGLNPGDVIKIAGTWTQSVNGQIRYSLTLDHYAVIGEAVSGDTIYIGAIGDFATDGFVCLSSAGNGNYYPLIPGDVSDSRMETDEVKAMGNKSLSLSSGDRTSSIVLGNGFDISSSDALNALVSNFRIDASGDKSEVISPDVVELTHSTSGNSIGVGVGSEGVNRGIYDYVFDKWVLYCNKTDLYIASSRGGAFKPYYTAGDTISLDKINTAGFVTSSKTKVYFSFNPGKPLYGVSSISCSSIDGLSLRQDGVYTHGSSSSSLVKPSSYLASAVGNSIGICATFTKTTNAVNNAPIGVAASIKITFA